MSFVGKNIKLGMYETAEVAFTRYKEYKYLIDVYTNVEKQVVLKELFSEFYNKCVACEFWATDIRKTELDMLIEGYTMRQILSAIKNNSCDDGLYSWALDNDIEKFRKIFKEVFGI